MTKYEVIADVSLIYHIDADDEAEVRRLAEDGLLDSYGIVVDLFSGPDIYNIRERTE